MSGLADERTGEWVLGRSARPGDFAGLGRCTLIVPEGFSAIIGTTRILRPGRHRLRCWPLPAVPPVALVYQQPFTLSLQWTDLVAGGPTEELLGAQVWLRLQVTEPARFWQAARPGWRAADLAGQLQSRVASILAPLVRRYAAVDLIAGGPAATQLTADLRPWLNCLANEHGLALTQLQPPLLHRMADVVVKLRRGAEWELQVEQLQLLSGTTPARRLQPRVEADLLGCAPWAKVGAGSDGDWRTSTQLVQAELGLAEQRLRRLRRDQLHRGETAQALALRDHEHQIHETQRRLTGVTGVGWGRASTSCLPSDPTADRLLAAVRELNATVNLLRRQSDASGLSPNSSQLIRLRLLEVQERAADFERSRCVPGSRFQREGRP